ncbi:NUDIX hydrolase [Aerococcus sanguinicola]|uniref:NUDIX hydrolase n=1 Tax=Aerococcus sanguinicola TaxID=119206 RepID=UPI0018A7A2A2|nr:NUDIX hydrolase [Aerococcus sanguinicola]
MEFGEKTLSSEVIYEGSLLTLEKQTVEIFNGEKANREIIHHAPSVGIIAIDEDQRLVLVKQFRKAIERPILEIPAGLVDPGEDFLAAAQRELEEETQLQAEDWQTLDKFYVSPGYLDEYLQIYSCRGLETVSNPRPQDADEHIEVFRLSLSEAKQAAASGEICDMKTIYAIQYLEKQLLKEGNHG